MKKKFSPRVVVAPLDWGLGHATRCIPLIKALLNAGCSVFVACNATAKELLSREFDQLCFLHLDGYNIQYASSKRQFVFKILQQIPKIYFAIRHENKWLQNAVKEHPFDLVISDNRYGFFHQQIPSIFITHQLFIQTPSGWLSNIVQKINYRFINRFSECWVPDFASSINLANALSHPKTLPSVPVTYIGPLARFTKQIEVKKKYKWLFIISGPEPQRTLFENLCRHTIAQLKEDVLLIRGLPQSGETLSVPEHCTVFNHLPTSGLQTAFAQSEYIVSRAGYTTVMEIIAMQKKAVLIPTPGQTEQEYLAKHLLHQQWCFCCEQTDHLHEQLITAETFPYQFPQLPKVSLQSIVSSAVATYVSQKKE